MQARIMVIDDDPDFVDGIKGTLEKADYAVDVAYNPKSGWDKLHSRQYNLLLLDILMGRGAEGVAMARRIKKDPRLRDMPVLIITGLCEQLGFLFPRQPIRAHSVETYEILEKPVKPKLLLDKVDSLLRPVSVMKKNGGA